MQTCKFLEYKIGIQKQQLNFILWRRYWLHGKAKVSG